MFVDYVTRRFNASSVGLKPVGGLTFAETPLARSPDSTGTPSHLKRGPLLKAPRKDGSSFRADLEQSTQKKPVYEIRSAQNRAYSPTGAIT
jgi:hypothetical protein